MNGVLSGEIAEMAIFGSFISSLKRQTSKGTPMAFPCCCSCSWVLRFLMLLITMAVHGTTAFGELRNRNAYATMMYMGTPRDYEFYVAIRVMIRSLANLHVDADLVVIASVDVPLPWLHALEQEDGAKVVSVENVNNPYKNQPNFDTRFKLTLNKLHAWNLVEYNRVVMLDADNIFLRKPDELFQCGEFCAIFINPCIFHTGLFVLRPSKVVYKDMIHRLEAGQSNADGADQGFIGGCFADLLDKPMFYPPPNGTILQGSYRLPLGYQMDATYYYLRLKWNVPCGANSVITFPGAPLLKPWYWWAYPVLPLGIQWHEQRRQNLGYAAEMPMVLIQSITYLGIIAFTRLARPNISKLCHRRTEKNISLTQTGIKLVAIWSILVAYTLPFFVIPSTVHPLVGWGLYLFGALALCSIVINIFMLPMLHVLTPWVGIFGVLLVMALPWYPDGVVRGLSIFIYAFCSAPFAYSSLVKIMNCLQVSLQREVFFPRRGESSPPCGCNKLY